jgi:hypothetical protein
MSNLFERLRDGTGRTLLTKYGEVFRIIKNNEGTFNASTGSFTVAQTSQDVKGKMFSLDTQFEGSELVEAAENEVYISASGVTFAPQAGMLINEVNASGTPLTIIKVRRIPESGAAVIYRLFVKR